MDYEKTKLKDNRKLQLLKWGETFVKPALFGVKEKLVASLLREAGDSKSPPLIAKYRRKQSQKFFECYSIHHYTN